MLYGDFVKEWDKLPQRTQETYRSFFKLLFAEDERISKIDAELDKLRLESKELGYKELEYMLYEENTKLKQTVKEQARMISDYEWDKHPSSFA